MGVREDRDEFENTGLPGTVKQLMREREAGFVRIEGNGWRGTIVETRPAPGSGPYIEYRRGYPLLRYSNASVEDQRSEEYRLPSWPMA